VAKHTDDTGRITWTRIVYVIELDAAACAEKRSPCGGTACGRTPIYVGQTALSAEDRFAKHKAGVKASKWVTRYGLHVLPELALTYAEMSTVSESEAAEVELAQTLRDAGTYCVYGGH
jgi:hypothetical protein